MRQFTFLWLLLMAYLPVAAQTAEGSITLTTQHDVPVAQAQIIVSTGDEVVDTLLTDANGVAVFSGWQITGVADMPKAMPIRISPNPGASQYVVVPQMEGNAVAQVYNLQGKIVAYPTLDSQQDGTAVFHWAADPQVADGIYIFRYGHFTSRILRLKHGTQAQSVPSGMMMKSNPVFTFACHFTEASPIYFQDTVFESPVQEGENVMAFDINAESYYFSLKVNTVPNSVFNIAPYSSDSTYTTNEIFYTHTLPTDSVAITITSEAWSDTTFTAGVHYGTNEISVAPTYCIYTIIGETNTDSVTYTLSRSGEVFVQSGLALQQTGNDHTDTITRLANQVLDSLEILVEKEGMHPWDTVIGMQAGLNEIDFPSLQIIPDYVLNEEVRGGILREKYPYTGNINLIQNAKIKLKGLNVNHTDSAIMNNEIMYYFYNLKVPADAQGQPIVAQYLRTILPTDTSSTQMFKEKIDTLYVTIESYNLDDIYVQQLDQNVTLRGTIADLYDINTTLDSANVIFRNPTTKEVIAQDITGADGHFELPNLECGTEGEWVIGYYNHNASGYSSRVGGAYTIKSEVVHPNDSLETFTHRLVPMQLKIPALPNDPNYGNTITLVPEYLTEFVDGTTNTEAARGRQIQISLGSINYQIDTTYFKNITKEIDSLFHEVPLNVPINDPQRAYKFVYHELNTDPASYDPYSEEQTNTGYNLIDGQTSSYGNRPVDNRKQYEEAAVAGGDVAEGSGNPIASIKEAKGRIFDYANITSGPAGFMNYTNTTLPTLQDRAIVYTIDLNDKQRWADEPTDYYKLGNVVYNINE